MTSKNSRPANAADLYKQAEEYWSQGKIDEAIACYQKSVEINPNFSWSYHKLGDAFSQLQQWENAISAYRRALEINPDFFWTHHNLGNALSEKRRWKAAISAYSEAIKLNSDFSWSYYNLGLAFSQKSRWKKAILAYLNAIQRELNLPEVYNHLGSALQQFFKEQETRCNALIRATDNFQLCLKVGQGLADRNYLNESLFFYNRALELQAAHPEILTAIEKIVTNKAQLDQKIASCYQAIQKNPHAYQPYYNLGVTLSRQQQWDDAILAYFTAIELKPEMPSWVYQGLWQVLAQQGKLAEAEGLYRKAIAQNPDSIWCYVNLGEVLTLQGKLDEAITCYQSASYHKIQQFYPDWMQDRTQLKSVSQPDFMIIGTQKGGTTSLYYYLAQHPQIMPSLIKEIDFWSSKFERGIDWYLAHFPPILNGQQILTGEATPSYLDDRNVAERLFNVFPEMKLIVLLRNPIDRAISHYYQWVSMNWEFRSLDVAIASEIEALESCGNNYWNQPNSYMARGVYIKFLKKWLSVFPREQVLILSSEKFYENPAETVQQVFQFLGLPDYVLPAYQKYNSRSYPEVDESIQHRLRDFFIPHNQALEEFLSVKFNWE